MARDGAGAEERMRGVREVDTRVVNYFWDVVEGEWFGWSEGVCVIEGKVGGLSSMDNE